MKKLFFWILFGSCGYFYAQTPAVSIDTMMYHLQELTSPKYEGRLPGTPGYDLAKDYTVNLFKIYGLQPYKGAMVEELFTEVNVIKSSFFETEFQGEKRVYELGKDYACRGFSGSGAVAGEAVFCGYGVSSDDYDDYKNVDVKDKIVVVMKGTPAFLPSSITGNFYYVRDKARVAEQRGAKAIVIITMPGERDTATVQGSVMCGKPPHLAHFPMIQPHYNCGKNIFATENVSLPTLLQKINETKQSQSFTMRQKMYISVDADYNPKAKTYNVVGMIEGSDPKLKDEYIIVGAHLDHVGKQGTDLIFPGADDNGSGVVTVLEAARIFNL
ncbi:MAG: M28 family peptidase, partial [Bacteroidales bacterium]|nr:M28 family peptidase [Bacteroidales bacterium]